MQCRSGGLLLIVLVAGCAHRSREVPHALSEKSGAVAPLLAQDTACGSSLLNLKPGVHWEYLLSGPGSPGAAPRSVTFIAEVTAIEGATAIVRSITRSTGPGTPVFGEIQEAIISCADGSLVSARELPGGKPYLQSAHEIASPSPARKAAGNQIFGPLRTFALPGSQTATVEPSTEGNAHIDTPAGSFDALILREDIRNSGGKNLTLRSYLARGVGVVREEFGKRRLVLVQWTYDKPQLLSNQALAARFKRPTVAPPPPRPASAPPLPQLAQTPPKATAHGIGLIVGDTPSCEAVSGNACPSVEPFNGFGELQGGAQAIQHLCDNACAYCQSISDGKRCREEYLSGMALVSALLNPFAAALFTIDDANDYCGLDGDGGAEWEPLASDSADASAGARDLATVTLIGTVAGKGCGPWNACKGDPQLSPGDDCLTHYDRDFELDLRVGDDAASDLSPANLASGGDYAGHDFGIEGEWMFLFPGFHSTWLYEPDDSDYLTPRAIGAAISFNDDQGFHLLRVPQPGDLLAAQGPVIADCGHIDAANFARTEMHPPVALAWVHHEIASSAGLPFYTVAVRIASSRTTSGSASSGSRFAWPFRGLDVKLKLPNDTTSGADVTGLWPVVRNFRYDYVVHDFNIAQDHSCVLSLNDNQQQQERPLAHLDGASFSRAQLDQLSAVGANATIPDNLSVEIRPAGFGEVEVLAPAPNPAVDPWSTPVLVGASADITLCDPGCKECGAPVNAACPATCPNTCGADLCDFDARSCRRGCPADGEHVWINGACCARDPASCGNRCGSGAVDNCGVPCTCNIEVDLCLNKICVDPLTLPCGAKQACPTGYSCAKGKCAVALDDCGGHCKGSELCIKGKCTGGHRCNKPGGCGPAAGPMAPTHSDRRGNDASH